MSLKVDFESFNLKIISKSPPAKKVFLADVRITPDKFFSLSSLSIVSDHNWKNSSFITFVVRPTISIVTVTIF